MSKKNRLKQYDELFDIEQMEMNESPYEEEGIVGIMSGMLEASNNQMMMAIELTKLIVGNTPAKNMEDHVFSVFKRATKVVGENFALQNLLEHN